MTKAGIIMHKFLMTDRKFSSNRYFDEPLLNRSDLSDKSSFINITQTGSNNYTGDEKQTQEDFVQYVNLPEGSVPWQYRMVTRIHDD